jgi:hypothetical protein
MLLTPWLRFIANTQENADGMNHVDKEVTLTRTEPLERQFRAAYEGAQHPTHLCANQGKDEDPDAKDASGFTMNRQAD